MLLEKRRLARQAKSGHYKHFQDQRPVSAFPVLAKTWRVSQSSGMAAHNLAA
jgi:hypothetical protein